MSPDDRSDDLIRRAIEARAAAIPPDVDLWPRVAKQIQTRPEAAGPPRSVQSHRSPKRRRRMMLGGVALIAAASVTAAVAVASALQTKHEAVQVTTIGIQPNGMVSIDPPAPFHMVVPLPAPSGLPCHRLARLVHEDAWRTHGPPTTFIAQTYTPGCNPAPKPFCDAFTRSGVACEQPIGTFQRLVKANIDTVWFRYATAGTERHYVDVFETRRPKGTNLPTGRHIRVSGINAVLQRQGDRTVVEMAEGDAVYRVETNLGRTIAVTVAASVVWH